MPGVNLILTSFRNLEMKIWEIQTQIKNQIESPKPDKDLIRQAISEEKEEELEIEQRKLTTIVRTLLESKQGTVEDRKRIIQIMLSS